MKISRYLFPLPRVVLTLGEAEVIDTCTQPAETIKLDRISCNVPFAGFAFMTQLYLDNYSLLCGGEQDLFDFVPTAEELAALYAHKDDDDEPDAWDSYMSRCALGNVVVRKNLNGIRLVGWYTGLVPNGYQRGERFNLDIILKGWAHQS